MRDSSWVKATIESFVASPEYQVKPAFPWGTPAFSEDKT